MKPHFVEGQAGFEWILYSLFESIRIKLSVSAEYPFCFIYFEVLNFYVTLSLLKSVSIIK